MSSEDQLQRRIAELEHESRRRSLFLASLGQQLQAEVNAIAGLSNLLIDSGVRREQLEIVAAARTKCDAILATLRNLSDFARIEAGTVELQPAVFPLHTAVRASVARFVFEANDKGLQLSCHIADDVPNAVLGDERRLRQVLGHLIENALQYTQQGRVLVEATIDRRGADEVVARIAVRDTGCGVPPARQRILFDEVYRDVGDRRHAWEGLGLAIVRDLANLMGGEIGAESAEGEGSTFWFTTRLELASFEPAEPTAPEPVARPVLFVSSDPEVTCEVLVHLQKSGFDVDLENDPEKFGEALMSDRFGVVVSDAGGDHRLATLSDWRLGRGGHQVPVVGLPRTAGRPDLDRLVELVGRWVTPCRRRPSGLFETS